MRVDTHKTLQSLTEEIGEINITKQYFWEGKNTKSKNETFQYSFNQEKKL